MPGLLTHLSVAFAGFILVSVFSRSWKYGLAFVIGQLIPDTIKFGIPGVMFKTANFHEILSKPLFWTLNYYTHHVIFWVIFCVLVFAIIFALYKLEKISKDKFKKWLIANAIFFMSIVIHLILDAFIIEKSYWI